MLDNLALMTSTLLAAAGDIDPLGEARRYVMPILITLMVVLAIAVTVIILMQKSTSDNIGTIAGESTDSSLDGKNKTRSKDRTLRITTIALGAGLLVVSIIYFILAAIG